MTNTVNIPDETTDYAKRAYISKASQFLGKQLVYPVEGIAPFDGLYVKMLTVSEMTDFAARCDEFNENNEDGLAGIREKALMIVDSTGRPMFDPDNREDVEFLRDMPAQVLMGVRDAFLSINSEDGLKKLQPAKNS
ncbi:hypothetical protein [Snodgrassella alvi]|uniref:hypothetical protein n=1 Tax=Snodgrassella alvi TaxID=1196083 RepID=UPI000C1E56BD|nr:hypothetical protein [Snodgrassella alvi]PIT32615.1 hypothetical protein BHC42_07395 [Snodgrassella alvi]PIT34099.1 hypothetical protein BHC50_04020 [Snodgrassella alvi]WLT03717.1 hypothetical protein RAM23_07855 [Snodgrassella alvi]